MRIKIDALASDAHAIGDAGTGRSIIRVAVFQAKRHVVAESMLDATTHRPTVKRFGGGALAKNVDGAVVEVDTRARFSACEGPTRRHV